MNTISMNPKVSIIIPVYNREKYITECIESALTQTFTDFEVVIVDNASTDQTWEICLSFAAKDNRVRVFRNNANIGPVKNWLKCLEYARGEFTKFLFSDDTLNSDCLQLMVPELENNSVGLVFCGALIGTERQSAKRFYILKDGVNSFCKIEFLDSILTGAAPYSPGAILLRTKDALENLHLQFPTSIEHHFENHGAGPDVMISILTSERYKCIKSISKTLVFFRSHDNSFSVGDNKNHVLNAYRAVFSLHLVENYGRRSLLKYLSFCWLAEIKSKKCLSNPIDLIKKNEGRGAVPELCLLLYFSLCFIMDRGLGGEIKVLN